MNKPSIAYNLSNKERQQRLHKVHKVLQRPMDYAPRIQHLGALNRRG